jgi:hypothetical protein
MSRPPLHPEIARDALLYGALSLLPVPLLDSLLQRILLDRLFARLCAEAGAPLDPAAAKALTGFRGSLLMGCLGFALWYPVKKLLRKLVYVLSVKDALDGVARAAAMAELVRRAAAAGLLPARAEDVRTRMDQAWAQRGRSPIRGLIGGTPAEAAAPGGGPVDALLRQANGDAVFAHFDAALEALTPAEGPR